MGKQTRPPAGSWQEGIRAVSPYLGLGMRLALPMVFFMVAGYGADHYLGTGPWLTLAGALVGFVSAFAGLFRLVSLQSRKPRPPGDDAKGD